MLFSIVSVYLMMTIRNPPPTKLHSRLGGVGIKLPLKRRNSSIWDRGGR